MSATKTSSSSRGRPARWPELQEAAIAQAPRGLDRRAFLKLSGLAGGGLMLAFSLGSARRAEAAGDGSSTEFSPNAFLHLRSDGEVVIFAKNPEIGQGVKTSLPMIVAEELEIPWSAVHVEQSAISNELFGPQFAGGSMSTPQNWDRLRRAGAVARTMLISAAAARWNVDADECEADQGAVKHPATGRSIPYADLVEAAAQLEVPDGETVALKKRADYKLLGKRITGVDNRAIVTGEPLFGFDQSLPGMRYAVFVKAPAKGATVARVDLEAVKRRKGVLDAFVLEGKGGPEQISPGVAIVTDSTWAALEAGKALRVDWNDDGIKDGWSALQAEAAKAMDAGGEVEEERGDFAEAFSSAAQRIEARYTVPFIPHATLEPQNCTAWFHDGTMEIWAPTQTPQGLARLTEQVTGVEAAQVKVHQLRIGGGFGRRLLNDYVAEVVAIAHRVDAPIKLVWSRETDMQHDFYRVGGFHSFAGALDEKGTLQGLRDHFIGFASPDRPDRWVRGGGMGANEFPLHVLSHSRLETTRFPLGIPCGWWRAPGACSIAWAVQSFLHELSTAAGRDHREFLLELMGEPRWLDEGNPHALNTGRAAAVIRRATELGNWGEPLPEGKGRGLAFHFCHQGHFAEVVELSVNTSKVVSVERVVVVGDVGLIVNRSGAENQVEGSVIDALSAMAAQEITFENGAVDQGNFDTLPLLRMPSQPKIETHFIESDFSPTGLGEPAFPPLAPAVCNAIFEVTGHRIRQMPISHDGFTL